MLSLDNVEFTYSEVQNFSFSLELEKRDSLAIVGPSGSGKTTLLHLIAGFVNARSGIIKIDGVNYTDKKPSLRPVNMLFQEHNLFSHLKIFDNIAIGIDPGLDLKKEERAKVVYALDRVGLKGFENRYPHQLSGGQRQRVAIARTLVRKGEVLLLDEPFSFLDPQLRIEMLDLIKDLHNKNSFIMIMVTHDVNDSFRVCNKTAYIENGNIKLLSDTKSFLKESYEKEIKAYLNYVPATV